MFRATFFGTIVVAALLLRPTAALAERPGLVPLTQLGDSKYEGFVGGLYAEGRNEPRGAHAEALKRMSASIQPLNKDGRPDSKGKIVILGVGASVCVQIFSTLEQQAQEAEDKSAAVEFVNAARGGQDVNKIADPSGRYWLLVEQSLAARGLSAAQVQVAWYQSDDLRDTRDDFPGRPQRLMESIAENMRQLKQHCRNVKVCYHSARHTTAFMADSAARKKHGEPRPWHVGWSVKWLIEQQAAGRDGLQFEGDAAVMPLCAWATYFWTNGDQQRADGYLWTTNDVVADGVHLSAAGKTRVAGELLEFFRTDKYAQAWFNASERNRAKP